MACRRAHAQAFAHQTRERKVGLRSGFSKTSIHPMKIMVAGFQFGQIQFHRCFFIVPHQRFIRQHLFWIKRTKHHALLTDHHRRIASNINAIRNSKSIVCRAQASVVPRHRHAFGHRSIRRRVFQRDGFLGWKFVLGGIGAIAPHRYGQTKLRSHEWII